jgi:predicted DNA-binding protein (UPF0251 family)
MLKFIFASIARRWRDWLPLLPIGALIALGYSGSGTTWAYVDLLAAAIVSMLVCNPLQLLSVLMAKVRICGAVMLMLVLMAVQLPALTLRSRLCLLLFAVAIGITVYARWTAWRTEETIKQSPEVDKVLAHVAYGGEWESSKAWEEPGCAETRALLHQSAGVLVNETEISSSYRSVYQLAYLHGAAELGKAANTIRILRGKIKKQEQELRAMRAVAANVNDLQADLKKMIDESNRLRDNLSKEKEHNKLLEQQVETLRTKQLPPESPETPSTINIQSTEPISRDAELIRLKDVEGMSYSDLAIHMDMTVGAVKQAVRRARARVAKTENILTINK